MFDIQIQVVPRTMLQFALSLNGLRAFFYWAQPAAEPGLYGRGVQRKKGGNGGMLKTSTDYDRSCMEELQWVAGKTFAKEAIRKKRIGAFSVGVLLAAGGLGGFVWSGSYGLLMLLVLGLLPVLWSVFYYPFTGWASCRNLGKNRVSCDFFLEKREVLMTQGKVEERFPYSQCAKLLEAEENIFLFMENGRGLIFNKGNLMGGSVEDLRALLQEKTGKKLEWCGRRRPPEAEPSQQH